MNLRMSIRSLVVVLLIANAGLAAAADGGDVTTALYVGRHFEVRDHDQPVKYVFSGDNRVARVIGSLSNRERLQRLRLQPAWNLISLAVTATNLVGQLEQFASDGTPLVSALYRWSPATRDFVGVNAEETIEAGTVLWLRTPTAALAIIGGVYLEPAAVTLAAGGGYVAAAGLERWSPQLPVGVTTSRYDAQAGAWRTAFGGELESVGDIPASLAPGDVIFVHTSEAVELATPDSGARFLFYHPDQLGSAAAVTDARGEVAEETGHYPFGAIRQRHHSGEVDAHYGFTQKEQDRESALHYFEARYVVSPLGRFPSFDPLLQNMEELEADELRELLTEPARLNPFAYALNNPTRYVDPDGRESKDVRQQPRVRTTQPQPRPQPRGRAGQPGRSVQPAQPAQPKPLGRHLTLRLGPPSQKPGEVPVSSFSIPSRKIGPSMAGGSGRASEVPHFSEIEVSRLSDDSTTELYMNHQHGTGFDSVRLIVPGKEGKDAYFELENVIISSFSSSGSVDGLMESFTFNAGSLRFKDSTSVPERTSGASWDLESGRGQ